MRGTSNRPSRRRSESYPDHAIARNQRSELVLRPPVGTGGALRQHKIAHVGGGVVHPYHRVARNLRSELPEYIARFTDHAGTVIAALVPVGWQAEQPARIARAQRTDDDVVHFIGIFHHDQLVDTAIHAERLARGVAIGNEQTAEF